MARIDGRKLRSHRESLGLSQAALAVAAGVSEKTVARAESAGIVHPATAQLLARALRVPILTLLEGDSEQPAVPLPPSVGRITIALDPNMLAELRGDKLEEFFRSILTLLKDRFSVELRLANDGNSTTPG